MNGEEQEDRADTGNLLVFSDFPPKHRNLLVTIFGLSEPSVTVDHLRKRINHLSVSELVGLDEEGFSISFVPRDLLNTQIRARIKGLHTKETGRIADSKRWLAGRMNEITETGYITHFLEHAKHDYRCIFLFMDDAPKILNLAFMSIGDKLSVSPNCVRFEYLYSQVVLSETLFRT